MSYVKSELINFALFTLQKWTVDNVSTVYGRSRSGQNLNALD